LPSQPEAASHAPRSALRRRGERATAPRLHISEISGLAERLVAAAMAVGVYGQPVTLRTSLSTKGFPSTTVRWKRCQILSPVGKS
jgi:hypothetical protein